MMLHLYRAQLLRLVFLSTLFLLSFPTQAQAESSLLVPLMIYKLQLRKLTVADQYFDINFKGLEKICSSIEAYHCSPKTIRHIDEMKNRHSLGLTLILVGLPNLAISPTLALLSVNFWNSPGISIPLLIGGSISMLALIVLPSVGFSFLAWEHDVIETVNELNRNNSQKIQIPISMQDPGVFHFQFALNF